MIEILLNAARVLISKDSRETATALVGLFESSPDWKEDICTIEARISIDEQERSHFLRDLLVTKLKSLSYPRQAVSAFVVTYSELVDNAFEHGTRKKGGKRPVRILADVSPSYIALSVFSPDGGADLDRWLQEGAKTLRESSLLGRGRGLLTVYRRADTLEEASPDGIKALIYREVVRLKDSKLDDVTLVTALSGHTNPSFGRRVVDYLGQMDAEKLVLCLEPINPEEFTSDELKQIQDLFEPMEELPEPEHEPDDEVEEEFDEISSKFILPILKYASHEAQIHGVPIRIVFGDYTLRDLLPRDLVSYTVRAAIESLGSD